ncbi:hypothetical protein ACF0H5_006375 [Mactra antiquata]
MTFFKMELNDSQQNTSGVIEYLTQLQIAKSIPVLCFISLIMIVGTIGNVLVIFTYIKRVEKSTTNLFIFSLAIFDVINCCLGLPVEMHDILNPYTNDKPYLCSIHVFISYSADISSGLIIVFISFDRYFRIATPHQGLSVKNSKLAIAMICIASCIIASLTLYVYGTEHVTFESFPGYTGCKCGIADRAKENGVVPLILNTLILVCFGIGVIILVTVYTLLGIKVRKWNKGRKSKQTQSRRSEMYFQSVVVSDDTESRESQTEQAKPETFSFLPSPDENIADVDITSGEETVCFKRPSYVRELSRSLEGNHFLKLDSTHTNGTRTLPIRKSESFRKRQASNLGRKASMAALMDLKKRIKLSRTTVMFISATIVFVASHIPFACIKIAATLAPSMTKTMSNVGYSFFLFAKYSYVLSYGANPIIYGFLNPKYRRECKNLLIDVSRSIKCKSKKFYLR